MRLDLNDWVDQHIFATGEFEPEVVAVVSTLLTTGGTAIDIGANVGYFSLLFSKLVGASGTVVAFEPQPAIQPRLAENLRLNPSLEVSQRSEAVSDASGNVTFYCGAVNHSGVASIRERGDAVDTVVVGAMRLDDTLEPDVRIDLIKIDVEGAEARVVRGMSRTLSAFHPDLIIEVSDGYLREMGSSGRELCEQLWEFGYKMFRLEWNGLSLVDKWTDDLPNQFNAMFTVRDVLPATLKVLR